MEHETDHLSVWQETGAVPQRRGMVARSTQHSVPSATFLTSEPATPTQLAEALTPCLALVAPVGMDEDAQATWFQAAFMALADYPAELVKRGAKAAMLKADHPSKIVPLIVSEVAQAMEWRKAARRRAEPTLAIALRETAAEEAERTEVGKMMGALVRKMEARANAKQ